MRASRRPGRVLSWLVVALVGAAGVGAWAWQAGRLPGDLARRLPPPAPPPDPAPPDAVAAARALPPGSPGNLKEIVRAMLLYRSKTGRYHSATGPHRPGRGPGGLSWRVHLLPYLDEGDLFREFRLDEPWDAPHNAALVARMPAVYSSLGAEAPPGHTHFQLFVNPTADVYPRAPFDPDAGPTIETFAKGLARTIAVIEGGAPVPWSKPADIPFDTRRPLPPLALGGNPRIHIATADATVRVLDLGRVSEQTLRAAITPDPGFPLGPDW